MKEEQDTVPLMRRCCDSTCWTYKVPLVDGCVALLQLSFSLMLAFELPVLYRLCRYQPQCSNSRRGMILRAQSY